jgi:hypothetical protein
MPEPKWKRFEKVIHDIHSQLAPQGAVVTLDDRIIGSESGAERQIDVSIRVNVAGYNILIVIECKDQGRPIDVTELGAFSSLAKDVNANKGVMISSSGYTEAALNLAKARAIDVRTYVDTESTDWRSEVSIPVLLKRIRLGKVSFSFASVPGYPFALGTSRSVPEIETYLSDGTPAGTIRSLLAKKWNDKQIPYTPGQHTVVLAEHVVVPVGSTDAHMRIGASVIVERCYYLGPLPIKVVGLRDEQTGSLWAKEFLTDFIEPAKIERGELPGWAQLPNIDELSIRPVITLNYVDIQRESADEPD